MTYRCRFCDAALALTFCDLGMSPLSNSYVSAERVGAAETFYPLHTFVCEQCWLVQLPEHERAEAIFSSDYAYFSSYSESWLAHARTYVEAMVDRFGLGARSQVVEIASNDGYLLQYFVQRGIPALGVEPAANCAEAARKKGVPTEVMFFGKKTAAALAARGRQADLLLGNNVLAHVPDINDFIAGLAALLKPAGVITMEFPHLLQLMRNNQFDTIYHEHYSYLSLGTVQRMFEAHGLTLFDVQELPTHGGSLRIFARHRGHAALKVADAVGRVLREEQQAGLQSPTAYARFAEQVKDAKAALLEFLIGARRAGKKVWGYGAPAKGNTLLNYCGVRTDLIEATVDKSPHKQGRWLPGTRIPVLAPDAIAQARPDYLLILPWNLRDEIVAQMKDIRAWGGRFVVPIPQVRVLP